MFYKLDIKNKQQIYWACRRGINELEILLITFLEKKYDDLTINDKYKFVKILKYNDKSIINWIINTNLVDNKNNELLSIIKLIKKHYIAKKIKYLHKNIIKKINYNKK